MQTTPPWHHETEKRILAALILDEQLIRIINPG
jgi:hypothetical protein